MDLLARCFLLIFAQLYVGGLLALSVPPFHAIARGFYKSTAGVFVGAGALMLIGRVTLLLRDSPGRQATVGGLELVELGFWLLSLVAGCIYLRNLWGDAFELRARAYVVSWMAGVAALVVGAQYFRVAPVVSLETLVYPASFILSALVLGGVTTGMLLGHWYLIDDELAIDPFRTLFRFFVWTLGIQAGFLLVAGAILTLAGSTHTPMETLFEGHRALLALRFGLSPVAAAGIAWMIWKTLQIPQTMAATGLFYIAILAVLVGEMMGRFILFRTSIPF